MFGDDRQYYSELVVRKRNQETNISSVIYSLSAITARVILEYVRRQFYRAMQTGSTYIALKNYSD